MAPRASIQQAIELLKVHQLRKENAFISQQIQEFRNEVSDLHDANDQAQQQFSQLQSDVRKYHGLAIKDHQQLDRIRACVDTSLHDQNVLHLSVLDLKKKHDSQFADVQHNHSEAVKTVENLKRQLQKLELERGDNLKTLTEEVGKTREALNTKTDKDQVHTINDRLEQVEHQLDVDEDRQATAKSTSRVCDSIEYSEINKNKGLNAVLYDAEKYQNSLEQTSNAGDQATEVMLSLRPCHRLRDSTVPNDLDLDEESTQASHASRSAVTKVHNDAPSKLQHRIDENKKWINKVAALRQRPGDTLTTYLRCGFALLYHLPQESADIVIHRLISGLANSIQKETFTRWLNETSWTRSNLEDAACLHGISRTDLSTAIVVPHPELVSSPCHSQSASVLVPATDNHCAHPRSMYEQKNNADVDTHQREPRRSQRLAAKEQNNPHTQLTGLETVSQAVALDARIAEASKRSTVPAKPQRCQITGRFLASKVTKSADSKTFIASQSTRSKRPSYSRVPGGISEDLQNDGVRQPTEIHVSVQLESPVCPRTPTKFAPNRELNVSESSVNDVSSPLHGRQARQPKQTTVPKQIPVANPLATPYRPRPRLVYGKHRTLAKDDGLTSDSDVFLPGTNKRAKKTTEKPTGPQSVQVTKKQRMPLPPPPEIPILSTSTEEDRRFERW